MSVCRTIARLMFCALMWASFSAFAQQYATVPLNNTRMPSDDLWYDGRILNPIEAQALAARGVDLSALDPAVSAVWSPGPVSALSESLDELPVRDGDVMEFGGPLLSAQGLFRFNARLGNTTAIIHLDRTLHTMLLRKNLLRRMGYQIPAMKWLRRLSVRFSSQEELNAFIDTQIPRGTLGAASRWVEGLTGNPLRPAGNDLTLVLHDVAVTIPTADDHYNLSQGVPPQVLTERTLRALIIPYALLDLGESANKFEWVVGRVSNNEIALPHFTRGTFTTTLEDARWALNILRRLSVEDFRQIVRLAHFPPEVAALVTEKLISRRNSLLRVFQQTGSELAYNLRVTQAPHLRDGKLEREDWAGYGSRFAHGDPESPFRDFHWYILAKVQALGIDNIISRVNQELSAFNPNEVRADFYQKQFIRGLNHFVETGEFLEFPVGTWYSPTASFNLTLSRDVVVGNYLGTDNLVQLADTIGYAASVGGHMGIENVPEIQTLAVRGNMSIARNWTHLKPLRNLRNVFREPYKNIIVPLLQMQLGRTLRRLEELGRSTNGTTDWNLEEDNSRLSQLMTHINENLGVGESLIFTERLQPMVSTNLDTALMGTPVRFRLNSSADILEIRRIQIFRKDAKTLQIYDDKGHGRSWTLDVSLERFIPIIRLGWRRQNGDYSIKLHEVNIDPSVEDNPQLFDNAHALAEFIQEGSSELLTARQKPHQVDAVFADRSFKFAFLFWRHKKLRSNTYFDITSRDGLTGKFVTFSDERQSGLNWEAFVKDVINYGFSRIADGVEWASPTWQNPAQTIGGMGTTTSVRFEANVNGTGQYDERFIRLTDRWEGWSASVRKVQQRMRETNTKFGMTIFDEGTLNNADRLKLFDIAVNLNLYEAGIQRLASLSEDTLIRYENRQEVALRYHELGCPGQIAQRRLSNGQRFTSCGTLSGLISQNRSCQEKLREGKPQDDVSKCLMRLFRQLYDDLNFTEITSLLGRENIFVNGTVNGFRDGDEILNDPIQSNTSGRIGSQFWNGPFDRVIRLLGIQGGEINGQWFRERL